MYGQERSAKASQNFPVRIMGKVFQVVMTLYLLAMLVGLPFYFSDGYTTIGTDKSVFFKTCSIWMGVVILPVAFVYMSLLACRKKDPVDLNKILENGEGKTNASKTDVFAWLFFLSLPLSFVFSNYKQQTIWGATGWFMGLIPQAIVVGVYFLLSKLWKPRKWVFGVIFFVSFAVFLLGYLNRFGIYPFPMKYAMPSFISTIGNINWYCGYLVTVFFVYVFFYWSGYFDSSRVKKILGGSYLWIGFGTLVTQGSASGLVALFVMLLILCIWSGEDMEKLLKFWQIAFYFAFSCLVTCLFRVLFPEAMVFDDWYISILTKGWFPILVTIVSTVFLFVCLRGCQGLKEDTKTAERLGKTLRKLNLSVVILAILSVIAGVLLIVIKTMRDGGVTIASYTDFVHFSGTWGSNRGATWMSGLFTFVHQDLLHKVVGVGPDCMSAYLRNCEDPWLQELLKECFGNAILTNAHNEWLTILVNEGIVGFVGFVGLMCSSIREFLMPVSEHAKRKLKKSSDLSDGKEFNEKESDGKKNGQKGLLKTYVSENRWIAAACGFGLLAYTINNMFSFQQSVNLVTMFILMGIGRAFYSKEISSGSSGA